MENLVFIENCEGFITKESFLGALKNVGNVILTYGRKTVMVSGLEAYKRIVKRDVDIVLCTVEENGRYYYLADGKEYIINVLD